MKTFPSAKRIGKNIIIKFEIIISKFNRDGDNVINSMIAFNRISSSPL